MNNKEIKIYNDATNAEYKRSVAHSKQHGITPPAPPNQAVQMGCAWLAMIIVTGLCSLLFVIIL